MDSRMPVFTINNPFSKPSDYPRNPCTCSCTGFFNAYLVLQ